ncbi:hypothetical protein K3495_g13901 [Podosphaera aphanis]|nr:hypothetical protein K3495_g13901 [Podosphaera aphanis]
MSGINASNAMEVDPFEDSSSTNTRNASETGCGGVTGAGKAPPNIVADLEKFKLAIKDDNGPPRAYKKSSSRSQGLSWANVASKPEIAGTTIRIQDETEKKELAKLSSEELVKKLGMKEIIGARQMVNGQVRVFYAEQATKKIMERQTEWARKLATTAQIASTNYQVLVHDMPLSFQPENPEHINELKKANDAHIPGINIQRAAWLKRYRQPEKKSGSLIVWFEHAEQADRAIIKGTMWKYELKATEIFRSGFRTMQCFNCQKYGHTAKNCSAEPRCGQCAGGHNTRTCPGKQEARCTNCSKKHPAWDQICPVRLAAKARAVKNRTQDPGRFVVQGPQEGNHSTECQIVGSRKRRAGSSIMEIADPVSEGGARRGPGRPKGSTKILNSAREPAKMISKTNTPTLPTLETFRPVTRDNQAEASDAPLCTMSQ